LKAIQNDFEVFYRSLQKISNIFLKGYQEAFRKVFRKVSLLVRVFCEHSLLPTVINGIKPCEGLLKAFIKFLKSF
jgi:hypothetical protein